MKLLKQATILKRFKMMIEKTIPNDTLESCYCDYYGNLDGMAHHFQTLLHKYKVNGVKISALIWTIKELAGVPSHNDDNEEKLFEALNSLFAYIDEIDEGLGRKEIDDDFLHDFFYNKDVLDFFNHIRYNIPPPAIYKNAYTVCWLVLYRFFKMCSEGSGIYYIDQNGYMNLRAINNL